MACKSLPRPALGIRLHLAEYKRLVRIRDDGVEAERRFPDDLDLSGNQDLLPQGFGLWILGDGLCLVGCDGEDIPIDRISASGGEKSSLVVEFGLKLPVGMEVPDCHHP